MNISGPLTKRLYFLRWVREVLLGKALGSLEALAVNVPLLVVPYPFTMMALINSALPLAAIVWWNEHLWSSHYFVSCGGFAKCCSEKL